MSLNPFSTGRVTFLLGCIAVAGCPDPQARFDEFGERYAALGEGGSNEGGATACTPTTPGEASGEHLFTLSAKLNPAKAFTFDTTLTTTDDGSGGLLVDLSLQPLAKEDQATPVGDPIVMTGLAVAADGTFEWDFGDVTLLNAANPISDLDVAVSGLVFLGSICGGDQLGFICGDVTGIVTAPLNGFDLTGSTFTIQRYETELPAPVINCAGDPATY
ncbi:MAG: hypothetical protein IPM79_18655 [Polyangiaceae bacterium]|jgi:hypothetical protein|nr:hypothetical protein [Polyangiaceae bacterium]MBK8939577.1 hypothetical protein [Polyangiaceae bacterium]